MSAFGTIFGVAFLTLGLSAADRSYFDLFTEVVASGVQGDIKDIRLVDAENSIPFKTTGPISFKSFQETGEFAGIKLGMTMSEVVAVWGKPTWLYSYCMVGPRFRYGSGLDLFFVKDRLVLISSSIRKRDAAPLEFNNGLTGNTARADCEKLLGPAIPRKPNTDFHPLFAGELAYRTGGVRIDFTFHSVWRRELKTAVDGLDSVSVGLEREIEIERNRRVPEATGKQPAAPKKQRTR